MEGYDRWVDCGPIVRGICGEAGQSGDADGRRLIYERFRCRVYLWDGDFELRRLRNLRFEIVVRKSNRHGDRSGNWVILIYSTSSDAKQPILATVRNGCTNKTRGDQKGRKKTWASWASKILVDVTRSAKSSKQNWSPRLSSNGTGCARMCGVLKVVKLRVIPQAEPPRRRRTKWRVDSFWML